MEFGGGSHCCHCYSSYCCELRSFPFDISIVSCPCLFGELGLGGWDHISILLKFSICKLFTDVGKEDGNLLSQASKLFRLIWNTSSKFGRLKCLQSPQAWNSLIAACNYHSNVQTISMYYKRIRSR